MLLVKSSGGGLSQSNFIGKFAFALALAAVWVNLVPIEATQASPQFYSFSGSPQIYVVPDGITSISATLRGAQGGSPAGGGTGGLGATVEVELAVHPGEVLMINVGGNGDSNGGWNGGGRGAGTGGGASDIRRPASGFSTAASCAYTLTCTLTDRVVVAGGGGGGGWAQGVPGNAHGGSAGLVADAGSASNLSGGDAVAGGGASASAGVSGAGTFTSAGQGATSGSLGQGGASAWVANATGGGGGGGYYGGGSGGVSQNSIPQADGTAGGGGGSSWAQGSGVLSANYTSGNTSGDGSVTIFPPSAIPNAVFGYTGTPQFYQVPSDVQEIAIRVYGAGGGAQGDIVYGRLPVSNSATLQLNIGGRGIGNSANYPGRSDGEGGWNGGGNGNYVDAWSSGSGGGGASDIRVCAQPQVNVCSLSDRVVVAGGGGGSSYGAWGLGGGAGGAVLGGAGGDGSGNGGQGFGATLIAGGAIGGSGTATTGSLGVGGVAGVAFYGTGGGGGGLYGGGGGNDSGGGGGSSCASATGSCDAAKNLLGVQNSPLAHTRGVNGSAGDGLAIITAMPRATTGGISNLTSSTASVSGAINAKFLASTPKLFLDTVLANIEGCASPASSCTPESTTFTNSLSASILAGNQNQTISGTITGLSANTTYFYRVCAQSVAGYACGEIETFSTALEIQTQTLSSAIQGTNFNQQLQAQGGSGSFSSWALVAQSALPSGLVLNSSSGIISGVPSAVGSGNFWVQVTDSSGGSTSRTISYSIAAPPAPPPVAAPTVTQPIVTPPAVTSSPVGLPPLPSVTQSFSVTVGSTASISIAGSNLANATLSILGNTATLQIVSASSTVISFTLPLGMAPGRYSLSLVNDFGTNVLTDALVIKALPVQQFSTHKFTIAKFAPGSPKLTRPQALKIRRELKQINVPTAIQCVGYTMGPKVLKSDLALARQRAQNTCNYLQMLAPEASISRVAGATSRQLGDGIRRVEVLIRQVRQ